MYKNLRSLCSLLLICLVVSSCKKTNSGDDAHDGPPPPDIGGLKMKRGLVLKTLEATRGYILFNTLSSGHTYLIDLDGRVVHSWDNQYGPSGGMYLKDNGNLVRSARDPLAPVYGGGGQGGYFQEFTWSGDLIWEYRYATPAHLAHHDMALMPNGNILAIAWEGKTVDEALEAGRSSDKITKAGVWSESIVEIKPRGKNEGEIVWEWHLWDHLIQDTDSTKKNFGRPNEHPGLLNVNLGHSLPKPVTQEELDKQKAANNAVTNATIDNRGADMFHFNAIDYHPELDQIVLSSPNLGEIFILDHSTTTAEAASHSGGRYKKGGDFLFRWGNPQNYNRGDSTDTKLGGQHDVRWIPQDYPGAGHLLVFNNNVPGGGPPHSAIFEIETPKQVDGSYTLEDDKAFGPDAPVWQYVAADTVSFWSPFISGAHRLANGNTFITEGAKGRYFEVTPQGDIVWDYLTPYAGTLKMPDGTSPQPISNFIHATFRATHIALDDPALTHKKLEVLQPQPDFDLPAINH
ncbi:MAG: aryl-sulfate sulfotransferase [Saprospiraceae bacterium]|nr:aryl-sulfate sulfotransferase [Saprospiraceae bacterium]